MVETKSNALSLERGKALPAQNRGITAEWQGNNQRTRGMWWTVYVRKKEK
jgi:hypothetical protein